MRTLLHLAFATALCAAGVPAWAQSDYPNRSIRLYSTQPPGGAIDLAARIIAQKFQESMGQTVIVETRAGGGGIVAMDSVAKATPDGYTLVIVGPSFLVLSALFPDLPFDPMKDLQPVSRVSNAPAMLVVTPSLPVKSVKELIEYARAHPGELNFASSAYGSSPHLGGELFKSMTGVHMSHVPYKGAAAMIPDLTTGRTQLSFASLASVLGTAKAGKLRALATTGQKRAAIAPELPTVAESGLPGFEVGSWQGIYAPAKTPAAITTKINREIVKAMFSPEIRSKLATDGTEPVDMSVEEFQQWLNVQVPRWTALAKSIGLKAD